MPKPSKKSIDLWLEFRTWIKEKGIVTTIDFYEECESKFQISEDKEFLKEIKQEGIVYYQQELERYDRSRYIEIEQCHIQNWRMVIGERESNGVMQIESIFPPTWLFLAPSNNI